ncbi:MAG TPA: CDGSH iron-sulfur domain-containing protein [Bacteroidota bacterium]|nr:CDGSH iron-sulfur domain-containing protein [Bacteroidota bacterium]
MSTRIMIKSNGSIKVEGDFEIVDQNGNKFDLAGRTAVSLCRSGQSNTKPFCDSDHRQCNFQSEIVAFALPPPKHIP